MLPPGASLVGPFSLPIVVCFTYKHTSNQLPAPPALLDWLAARVCPFWLQSDVSFGEGTAYLFFLAPSKFSNHATMHHLSCIDVST
jgi:hypothetical protein